MSIASTFEQLIADWASTITNRAIDADPDMRLRLNQLEGRAIELNLTNPTTQWHLQVLAGRLALRPGRAETPNDIVTGGAIDLASWLLRQDASGVEITGDDTTLLETLAALRSYNPEFQESLGQIFGPQFSERVVGGAEAGLRGIQSVLQALGSGLEQEATERFVKRENLDDLLTNIDDLRLRVDRLAANIRAKENPQ